MPFIAFCHASGIAIWATVQTARNRVPCCIRPVDFRFIHFPTSYFFVEYVTHHRIPLSFHICLAHGHSIGYRTCTPSVVNHSHGCICRMRPCTPIRKSPDARRRDTILQYTGFQTACIARPQTLYTPRFSLSRNQKLIHARAGLSKKILGVAHNGFIAFASLKTIHNALFL